MVETNVVIMKQMRPENPSVFIPGMVVFGVVTWVLIGLLFSDDSVEQAISGAGMGFLLSLIFILERWIQRRKKGG